jgi:hypothetical protein
MKRHLFHLITILAITATIVLFYGCKKSPTAPSLTTDGVNEITYTTASCSGNVTGDGGSQVTDRGICWSETSDPTIANSSIASGTGTGSFSVSITGLKNNTTYYVRAFATNNWGTSYGESVKFTTEAFKLAEVTTDTITDITTISATCQANILSDGGSQITTRGICWDNSPLPTISDNFVTEGPGTGPFSCFLTSLNSGLTYYARAFATNEVGTAYGNEILFNTPADFRDGFVGTYTCLKTYFYFAPIGDSMVWATDTISFNSQIGIEKMGETSLKVIIGTYNYEAQYEAGNKFVCTTCNGPYDYVRFFAADSIYSFRKFGVTNNYDYYGKKNQK